MSTPIENSYSMPAEWFPHECCWMQWPHEDPNRNSYLEVESWSHFDFEKGRHKWAEVAKAISNFEKVKSDLAQIEKALELFRFNELRYPTTNEGLSALVKPSETLKNIHLYPEDGYIKSIPKDPWGNPYLYLRPGVKSASYDLFTYGADNVEGGTKQNADIGNWSFKD